MGEIYILDEKKATTLLSLGFKYVKRTIDNKDVFVFIQTNELMKALFSNFDKSSFLLGKNVCF